MDYDLTYNFFKKFREDSLVIIYSGHFNDRSLISLTDIIGLHYELSDNRNKYKGRFVYLTVETFQNVIRYAKPLMKKININGYNNFFYTRKKDDDFFISTANLVDNNAVKAIKDRIEEVNKLERQELNKKYKEVLLNQAFSKQGGAGLGFIEMSRKTQQKLEYMFEKIKADALIYYLFLKFITPQSQEQDINNYSTQSVQEMYKLFIRKNIILFIKHEFNESINEAIFRVTEMNMQEEDSNNGRIIFQLSVEALQNISKHAYAVNNKKEGIYYIRKEDDNYIVTTGNYISNLDIESLSKFLDLLKNSDKEGLNYLYREKITSTEEFDGNGGLGFIDIARTAKCFEYKFFNINENYSFFVMVFKV